MEKLSGKGGRSGLPADVKISDYPKCQYINSDLDDSMTNIDEVKNKSIGKAKKHPSYQK